MPPAVMLYVRKNPGNALAIEEARETDRHNYEQLLQHFETRSWANVV